MLSSQTDEVFMDRTRCRTDHVVTFALIAVLTSAFAIYYTPLDFISTSDRPGHTPLQWYEWAGVISGTTCMLWLMWLIALAWSPMERDRTHLKKSLHDSDSDLHAKRVVGKGLPPAYPDGWRCVCLTHELKPGSHKSVTLCGRQVVVYRPVRGSGTEPVCLSAYCSHLGAHIGAGGRVVGCEMECPFH